VIPAKISIDLRVHEQIWPFTVLPDTTIRIFKLMVETDFRLPADFQKIVIDGREIKDDNVTLKECKINKGSKIELHLQLKKYD
jgi:hypothetical protein